MCITSWIAAICLVCSEKKGVPRFHYLKDTLDDNKEFVPKKNCLCMCCCPADVCRYDL